MLVKVVATITEALKKVEALIPQGAPWDSAGWQKRAPAIRERAFFSSRVESIKMLSAFREHIRDYLAENVETLPDGKKALIGGKARFVEQMNDLMEQYPGLLPEDLPTEVDPNDITDIRSESRLDLVFDTNVRQAYGHGEHIQAMHPVVLAAFPGWRFVRVGSRDEPRPRHAAAEGQVRLKTDRAFWLLQNSADIGGFEVPHGPWGFRSGMGTIDVSRDEVEQLGLAKPGQRIPPKVSEFNEGLKTSLRGVDPELKARLKKELGKKYKFTRSDSVEARA